MKIFQFFYQNYGNSNILTFSQMYFYSLKSFLFYLEYRNQVFFLAYFTLGSKNIKSGLACTAGVESGRGQGRREKGGGVGIAHFTFLILTVWGGGEMTSQDWWQKFIFFNWQNGFSGFEGPFVLFNVIFLIRCSGWKNSTEKNI